MGDPVMGLWWDDPNSNPLEDIRAALRKVEEHERAFPWQPNYIVYPRYLALGTSMDTYVAIYPYTPTNPTKKFRVVKNEDWQAVINGEKDSYKFTEYDNQDEAVNARDRLNNPTKKADSGQTTE